MSGSAKPVFHQNQLSDPGPLELIKALKSPPYCLVLRSLYGTACVFSKKTDSLISVIKHTSASRWIWEFFSSLGVIFQTSLSLSLPLPSISESFLTVKGAALFLPRGNGSSASSTSRFSQLRSKHAGKYWKRAFIPFINKRVTSLTFLCFFRTRRHPAASANHVYSPQTRGQHQTGG